MLVDNVTLVVKAGNGGNGSSSLMRNGQTAKGGPDGGNGGHGGDIYFQGSHNISDLSEFRFKKKIVAENGTAGKGSNLFGKNAEHTTILVPLGTSITDTQTGNTLEILDTKKPMLLAKGGKGGLGNNEFKSATNQTPTYAEPGELGETKTLLLSLRLIADVGLVGLPNAGKSSLLGVLTNATPKIGNYPFTTLQPNIGMMDKTPIADIPGIIEGASQGKGLGIGFLQHTEKTKILLHCIDATSEHVLKDYEAIRSEFEKYNPELLKKQEIILLTKIDLVDEKMLKKNREVFEKRKKETHECSIYQPQTIEQLKKLLNKMLVS
jgi:GTP-binding protein